MITCASQHTCMYVWVFPVVFSLRHASLLITKTAAAVSTGTDHSMISSFCRMMLSAARCTVSSARCASESESEWQRGTCFTITHLGLPLITTERHYTKGERSDNNNNNIMITKTMFMVLSSWQSHCESSPGSFDECRMAPSGRRPSDQARQLRL